MGKIVGRPAGPYLKRFEHVGKHHHSCVYLLGFDNGVVKIGFSEAPAFRLAVLAKEWDRQSIHIDHFCVFTGGRPLERACIARLHAVAQPLPGRLEYFTGIGYDEALALVQSQAA